MSVATWESFNILAIIILDCNVIDNVNTPQLRKAILAKSVDLHTYRIMILDVIASASVAIFNNNDGNITSLPRRKQVYFS